MKSSLEIPAGVELYRTFPNCNLLERPQKGSGCILEEIFIEPQAQVQVERRERYGMDHTLQRDRLKLATDTKQVKELLEMLEKDQAIWARKREEKDLAQLIKRVKKLGIDVSMMMSDFVCVSRCEDQKGITEGLDDTFACLNALFQDRKKAREDLNDTYIHPEEIRQLEIDWGKFLKAIGQIQKHLH